MTPNTQGLARWWHPDGDRAGLICDLCPRSCHLKEGQHGACLGRECVNGAMRLRGYGRTSGFGMDPIEKKPLNHFLPGSRVFSFGTLGCNLACRFCQNWNISKTWDLERLQEPTSPQRIVDLAREAGATSVAFTYNDPVVFSEYAIDVATACHAAGLRTVAVTAGYIHGPARAEFFGAMGTANMDAANIDLKAFSESFYRDVCGGHLEPVLDTLSWIRHESQTWLEITTLLIPGLNDGDAEVEALCRWIQRELGPETPLHLTAFHPDHHLLDRPPTSLLRLQRARTIARGEGLCHVYIGNAHEPEGSTTRCPGCGHPLIQRYGYRITAYRLLPGGLCPECGTKLAGCFDDKGP